MLGDKLWVRGEVRRLTTVSETMLAAHHRAEGQLTVYRMILEAMQAEEQDANADGILRPDDSEPSLHIGEQQDSP